MNGRFAQRPRQGKPVRASAVERPRPTHPTSNTACLLSFVASGPPGGAKGLATDELDEEARMTSTTLDPSFSCTTPNASELHRLISHFFTDYLRLVEPDSAAQMHLQHCQILPAPGEGKNAHVVHARVPCHLGEEVTVLAAIEPVARPEPLAWAIAPFMRSASHSQSALFEAARARVLQARLADDKSAALLRFLTPDLHRVANDEATR
jgi:hypothetical protein